VNANFGVKKIVVVDTGAGNIPSVARALTNVGCLIKVSKSQLEIENADGLVMPGVGAFPKLMKNLSNDNLTGVLKKVISEGKHVLGICVGMQVLTLGSDEFEFTKGFELIQTRVSSLESLGVRNSRVPHVGWNEVSTIESLPDGHPLKVIKSRHVYFMHSFALPQDSPGLVGHTEYEIKFCSAIQIKNALGVQFHPEKSHNVGLDFLSAWASNIS
jgi:glutamine amidotransferase